MSRQMTLQEQPNMQRMRQPPSRSRIVIAMRRLAGVMRIPPEHTAAHEELIRTFGELSWNEEHLHSITTNLYSNQYGKVLTRTLIDAASRETLPKGANPSLGCMDCNETSWRQKFSRDGYSYVVRCECSLRGKQAELASA